MKKILAFFIFGFQVFYSQNVAQKLDLSVKSLLNTSTAYASNISVYVADESGNFIYEYQGNKGLSTASTQKIFTAACALETLGSSFTYSTTLSYSGAIKNEILEGNLYVFSTGDPTLGSWRYQEYQPENFKQKVLASLKKEGIKKITGNIILDDSYFDFQTVPGGWPWNDMGNYYGAGVWGVNWRENQFDMNMNGEKIKSLNVNLPNVKWINEVETSGNTDQSLVFTAPHSNVAYINGKLPAKNITVSGSMPNPPLTLGEEIKTWLQESAIGFNGKVETTSEQKINGEKIDFAPKNNLILNYKSPTLDKIVYWFLRKSINFYGETLIKTLGKEKQNEGSFDAGVNFLKNFWKSKGINPAMINFADGSGLSPQNYASARAEVQALVYAKKQTWFPDYYEGFPTQENGMKMKSGTMKDTKSFAGYHTSKDGKKYVFSIIINNYSGNDISSALYSVLNNLK